MEIDLTAARTTVRELAEALAALDGEAVDETPTRTGQRQRVRINRTLQHLAHLADKASVQITDTYWAFKEHDQPGKDQGPG